MEEESERPLKSRFRKPILNTSMGARRYAPAAGNVNASPPRHLIRPNYWDRPRRTEAHRRTPITTALHFAPRRES